VVVALFIVFSPITTNIAPSYVLYYGFHVPI
jgi:hypothetical protein